MKKLYVFIFVLFFGLFCFWQNASIQKAYSCPPGEVDIGGGICAKPAACGGGAGPGSSPGAGVGPGHTVGPSADCITGSSKSCEVCCLRDDNCASASCEIPPLVPPTSGTCIGQNGSAICHGSCLCPDNNSACTCTSTDANPVCKVCTDHSCSLSSCTATTCTIPSPPPSTPTPTPTTPTTPTPTPTGTCPCTSGTCSCTTSNASSVCEICPTSGKCSNDSSISCTVANASTNCKTCIVNSCVFNPAVQNPGLCKCAAPEEVLSCAKTAGCDLPTGYVPNITSRYTCVTAPDGTLIHDVPADDYHGNPAAACGCPLVLRFGQFGSDQDFDLIGNSKVSFKYNGLNSLWTSWIPGSTKIGLLASDFNHNGSIDNGKELFGEYTNGKKYKNGYAALSNLRDKDHNNLIEGDELKDLVIWFDLNEDAISQPSEIEKLSDMQVVEIGIPTANNQSPIAIGESAAYPYLRNGFKQKVGNKVIYGGDTFDLWFDGMHGDETTVFAAMN